MPQEYKPVHELQVEWRKALIETMQHNYALCDQENDHIKENMNRIEHVENESTRRMERRIDKLENRITDMGKDARKLIISLILAIFAALVAALLQFLTFIYDKI